MSDLGGFSVFFMVTFTKQVLFLSYSESKTVLYVCMLKGTFA
jgi:hypothetical protein